MATLNKININGTDYNIDAENANNLAPLGTRNSGWNWGTLTNANGWTQLYGVDESGGGSIGVAAKSGQISIQIDGDFYGSEGQKRCAYTDEVLLKSKITLSGSTLTIDLD